MEKRRHLWNGRWGRLARHDVMIYEDGGIWWVEHRIGGVEGRSRWHECVDADTALNRVRDLISGTEPWRDLSDPP